jgi:flap endonuclease-1
VPELLELERLLADWRITREQLVDLAVLVGTDFNPGVKGIGPKKALKLVQQFGRLEDMPAEIRDGVTGIEDIREIYLRPSVMDTFDIGPSEPDLAGIETFLVGEREFSKDRVKAALDRTFRERMLW